jgi:erythromycin esterase
MKQGLHRKLRLAIVGVLTVVGTASCTGATSRPSPGAPTARTDSSVRQWLTAQAIPLTVAVDDATGARLDDLIGAASLIGLGQPTHGTHEFMAFDQALIEFAVTKLRYRTVSIEAPWTAAQALDDYVNGSSTKVLDAVSAIGEWPWSTHEMADLLDWLRTFNTGRPSGGSVHITTFDPQYLSATIYDDVQQYFMRHDPADATAVQRWLDPLVPTLTPISEWEGTYLAKPRSQRDAAATAAADAYGLAATNRDRLVASSGAAQYATVLQELQVIVQHARLMSEQSEGNSTSSSTGSAAFNGDRDNDMAGNLTWTRDHLASPGGVIVLAHNAHVEVNVHERQTMYDPHGSGFQSMGWHLRAALGNEYLAIGGSFASGRFNAIGSTGGVTRPLQPYDAGAVDPSSANATFATVQQPAYLVDLRHSPDASVSAWLRSPQRMRFVGGLYDSTKPQDFYETVALSAAYDIVLHLQNSTPTHLVPVG